MDRGSWQATVHGVTKESDTTEQLNNNNTTGLTAVTSREQTYGHGWGRGDGDGGTNRQSSMETCTLPYVKQPTGICYMTQGTQTRAL